MCARTCARTCVFARTHYFQIPTFACELPIFAAFQSIERGRVEWGQDITFKRTTYSDGYHLPHFLAGFSTHPGINLSLLEANTGQEARGRILVFAHTHIFLSPATWCALVGRIHIRYRGRHCLSSSWREASGPRLVADLQAHPPTRGRRDLAKVAVVAAATHNTATTRTRGSRAVSYTHLRAHET